MTAPYESKASPEERPTLFVVSRMKEGGRRGCSKSALSIESTRVCAG